MLIQLNPGDVLRVDGAEFEYSGADAVSGQASFAVLLLYRITEPGHEYGFHRRRVEFGLRRRASFSVGDASFALDGVGGGGVAVLTADAPARVVVEVVESRYGTTCERTEG